MDFNIKETFLGVGWSFYPWGSTDTLIPLGVKAGMETRPKSLIEKSKRNFKYISPASRTKREMWKKITARIIYIGIHATQQTISSERLYDLANKKYWWMMNPEYDVSNLHNALHMDNLHDDRRSHNKHGWWWQLAMASWWRWCCCTKAIQCIADTVDKGDAVYHRYSGQSRCSGDKWLKVGRRCHHDGRTNKQGNIELLS